MPLAINIECCPKLAADGQFKPFFAEFEAYKLSSDTHSRPTTKEQQEYVSVSELFGRDRANVDEEHPYYQRQESLSHLHTKQEDSEWEDEDGDRLVQWECTSDSYLIYSYFVFKGVRYYYVVDFIDNGAHANWDNQEAKMMWVQEAKAYRESKQAAAA